MKLIEKLKKLVKNITFIAWFVLTVIGTSIFLYNLSKQQKFTTDNTLPDTLVVDGNYKVKKINPLQFKRSFNPHIYGDNILYEVNDDPLHSESSFVLYNIATKKTRTTRLHGSYHDINMLGDYVVLSKLEQPNSDTYIIYLYDIKKDKINKIGDTHSVPDVFISGNYIYWVGDGKEEILKRYDITTRYTSNYSLPYMWRDAHKSMVVYLEPMNNNSGYLSTGDLNRLVLYDTNTRTIINLPEDKAMKNYIKLSDDYVTWVSYPWEGSPKIKYYSVVSGEVKDVLTSSQGSVFDLNIDGDTLVYFSNKCMYKFNITQEKESKILCDENINDINDSIDINKNIVFDIPREDDFKNRLSDVFLIKL